MCDKWSVVGYRACLFSLNVCVPNASILLVGLRAGSVPWAVIIQA